MSKSGQYVPADKVVSYHPIQGLVVKDATCPMDYSELGNPGERLCGRPATTQIVWYSDGAPYWAEWWCPDHAATFTDDAEAAWARLDAAGYGTELPRPVEGR